MTVSAVTRGLPSRHALDSLPRAVAEVENNIVDQTEKKEAEGGQGKLCP